MDCGTKSSYKTTLYNVEFIYGLYKQKRINLDIAVQRSYLWNDEKQQDLWDTLLGGFRIPEIHAIQNGNRYDIIDGKQRLTTIFMILDNKIPFKKRRDMKEDFLALFNEQNEIYFKDLPQSKKTFINQTDLSFAIYSNLNADSNDYAMVFRKINSGHPLSEIDSGISQNICIRTHYTDIIMKHPVLYKDNFSIGNDNDLELALVRFMGLMKYKNTKALDPKVFPYKDFSVTELAKYCSIATDILNRIPTLKSLQSNASKKSALPHILWDIYRYDLKDAKKIKQYIDIFSKNYSSSLTSIRNFNVSRINFVSNLSDQWIKEVQE